MYSVLLAAAVNFSLDLVLCSFFGKGIIGAAWATLVSQYCAAGLLIQRQDVSQDYGYASDPILRRIVDATSIVA